MRWTNRRNDSKRQSEGTDRLSTLYSRDVAATLLVTSILFVCVTRSHGQDGRDSRLLLRCDGSQQSARLVALTANNATFRIGDSKEETVSLDDIVFWGESRDPPKGAQLLTPAGNRLAGELLEVGQESLTIENGLLGRIVLPRSHVLGILFQPSLDLAARDLQENELTLRTSQDRVWLINGDIIGGRLVGAPQEPASALFGLPEIQFVTEVSAAPLRLAVRDTVMVALHGEDQHDEEGERPTYLALDDGSVLVVRDMIVDAGRLRLSLADHLEVEADASRLVQSLTLLQPTGRRVVYLSDLEPVVYQHIPFLDRTWPLGRNRNLHEGRLRAGGRVYLKGLAMHSAARVVYDVPEGKTTFAATLALDDTAGQGGHVRAHVVLEIEGDGESTSQWKVAFTSPDIRSADSPLPIRVPLANARRIALVVDFAARGDVLDHLDWLNACFLP